MDNMQNICTIFLISLYYLYWQEIDTDNRYKKTANMKKHNQKNPDPKIEMTSLTWKISLKYKPLNPINLFSMIMLNLHFDPM